MNKKYTFTVENTMGYSTETDYIITDGIYDFYDYLNDRIGGEFEIVENGTEYNLYDDDDELVETYHVIKVEDTDEQLTN